MKKFKITALLIALIMVFSGCSLISIDEERVANQVVAVVNGTEIYKYEVDEMAEYYAYYLYGIDPESEDEAIQTQYEEILNSALDEIINSKLLLQKASELSITLADEEKEEKLVSAQDYFKSIKERFLAEVESEMFPDENAEEETQAAENTSSEEEITEEADEAKDFSPEEEAAIEQEAEKRYQEYLEEYDLVVDDYYVESCNQMLISKVRDYVYGLADLTDEEVKEWYDQTLEMQKEDMDNSAAAFSGIVNNNNICTYVPEDTVAVKQVLLKFKDEELVAEATTLYSEDKVDEMMALLQPEIDELSPTALDVKQRLEDGESIDDLIAELGEDDGMTMSPGNTYGYLVESRTDSYIPEFSEAALGLFTVGDISEPVVTYYGLHILQSIKVYEKGVVPFEDIQAEISGALLPIKEQEKYEEITQKWLEEADVVYYRARLT